MASGIAGLAVIAATLCSVASCRTQAPSATRAEEQRPAPVPIAQDSAAASRQQTAQSLLAELGPRTALPAESVFTNIRILRGMPAGQLIRIMDGGFGRALGVTCAHCHEQTDWASDAKPAKRIARGMWAMDRLANEELRTIPDVSPQAVINCTTCHQGRVKPVANLR